MSLSDVFSKIKNSVNFKKKNAKDSLKTNQRLILSLRGIKRPSLKQVKHILKVLSPREKRIMESLMFLMFFCFLFIAFVFVKSHIIIVPSRNSEYIEGIVGFPRFINPIFSRDSDVDGDLTKLIFSSLLKYDKNLELVPDLAASYSISDDQKIYNFKLREDVLWTNGEKFTADDVIFTLETIKDPEYKSPLYSTFKTIEIKKNNDYELEFSLKEPYSPFLNVLTFGILPQNVWADVSPQNATLAEYNIKPVGAGMYKLKTFTKDKMGNIKTYSLTRNDNYYGNKPYIKNLILKFYPDFDSISFALKSKEIQGASFLPKPFREEFADSKNLEIKPLQLPQYTALFFNQEQQAILKETKIRIALTLGIDKNSILDEALSKEGVIIDSPILPGFVGYNPNLEKYSHNPQEANKMLDDLGWEKINSDEYIFQEKEKLDKSILDKETEIKKLEGADNKEGEGGQESEIKPAQTDLPAQAGNSANGEAIAKLNMELNSLKQKEEFLSEYNMQAFLRKKDGKLLELSLTTVNNEDNVKVANKIKSQWNDLGVFTKLEIIEAKDIDKNVIKPRAYDCLLYGEIIGADPDPYPFWHSSQNKYPGLNLAVFSNAEVDKLLEEARQTSDMQKRNDKYIHFQNILVKEQPAIFLYSPVYSYVLSKKVKGFETAKIYLPRDRFSDIEDWYVATERAWK